MVYFLLILFGLIAGFIMPVQSAVNTTLRGYSLGSPFIASTISFIVGTITLVVITAFKGDFNGLSMKSFQGAPWWVYTGGILGAIFVLATVVLTPRIGVAAMMTIILMGQLIASLIIDHYGLFGLEIHTATLMRITGVILIGIGVVIVQLF